MESTTTEKLAPTFLLSDVLNGTQGQLVQSGPDKFQGIGTDTRKCLNQNLFFAIKGENFDAHQFLSQAVVQGVAGLVVDRDVSSLGITGPAIIRVNSTLEAIQNFAHYWRRKMPAKVVAMTGSNGKTTTKMFLASLLENHFEITWTGGSLNNHLGVPLTLLEVKPTTQWTILEMGMNHLGEIARLCQIGEPDVVAVTMVGRAHIENLGSQEAIAQAKDEIYLNAKPNATRVYNIDNPFTKAMAEQHVQRFGSGSQRVLFSNLDPRADVFVKFADSSQGRVDGHLFGQPFASPVNFFGEQNVVNLAAAMALACGCAEPVTKIIQSIPRCSTGWGRNQWINLPSGARALFDAYNANPDSMAALLANFRKLPATGQRFAVLGDMKELGNHAKKFHEELGGLAALGDFAGLWFVGEYAADFERGVRAAGFDKKLVISNTYEESLALSFASMINPGDVVAIKASRGVGLEKVLQYWGVHLPKY